jgi:outer membrane receptor protein involved in Fe transport
MKKKLSLMAFAVLVSILFSQTTGKIKGTVKDENGQPLPGANIIIEGTNLGAETDAGGYYFIIGVRAGTYNIRAEFVGYRPREAQDVRIRAGLTTNQDFRLNSDVIELETIGVEVVTERKVDKDVTTSVRNIDMGNVDKLAVTHVDDILRSTPGVKKDSDGELHFRGGRAGEVNYIIDGITVGDPTGSKTNPVEINFANVESFNILKGVPDAEFGDALSGSVNIILKTGSTEKTSGHVKYVTDSFFGENKLDYQRGEFSLSGPVPLPFGTEKPTYYIGTDLSLQNGLARSFRKNGDADGEYAGYNDYDLTGLGFEMPQKRENSFNMMFKLAYDFTPTMKLSGSYMRSVIHNTEYDYFYCYTPQTATETVSNTNLFSLNWRHTIDRQSFYDIIVSRYNRKFESLPGGKKPDDFIMADTIDIFNINHSDPASNHDVLPNGVRDGGSAEGYFDVNQNGYFDREYYIDNSGSGIYDPDNGDLFIPYDPAYDANMNGRWDGDILYDANRDGKWNYTERGISFTGFGSDRLTGEIVEGYQDRNMNGRYDENVYTGRDAFPGSDEPYIDGDSFNDTGEPFVDQRRLQNLESSGIITIVETPNGKWDPATYSAVKIYTARVNDDLGIDEVHKDYRPGNFEEILNFHVTDRFYMAKAEYFSVPGVGSVTIEGTVYELVDRFVGLTYIEEDFADLKSSLGSELQPVPRTNNVYNTHSDGIFDEFEAYCYFRPFGSSVNEDGLGWKNAGDHYEYTGSYVGFKVPKIIYDSLPNLKEITHNEHSTWTNRNPAVNMTYDRPDGLFSEGEEFTDYNFDNTWNTKNGFLVPGHYTDGITYSLLDNTVTKFKGNYTNQISKFHMIKTGFELVLNDFDYYSLMNPYDTYDTERYDVTETDPYPYRGLSKSDYNYKPWEFSYFAQDKMEFEDLVVNAGVRLDMRILDDKAVNYYKDKAGEGISGYEEEIDKVKFVVSPRFGISHSISETSKLFFSYGHLYQLPQYTLLFDPNTKALENPLFGNMNLGYERNVQYELGVVREMGSYLIDLTGYFKDIYDMINTKTYRYALADDATVYSNSDYGKSRGIELSVDKSLKDRYLWSFSYTLAYAYGKSSNQTSNYTDEKLVVKEFPLNWDERHTINAYFALVFGKGEYLFGLPYSDDWTMSFSTDYGSGKPFTPSAEYYGNETDPKLIITNSERMPWTSNTDVRLSKTFQFADEKRSGYGKLRFELNVYNLFDKVNVTSVYSDSGSWYKRSEAYYNDAKYSAERSNLTDIFKNPANIEERRHYSFGISYLW